MYFFYMKRKEVVVHINVSEPLVGIARQQNYLTHGVYAVLSSYHFKSTLVRCKPPSFHVYGHSHLKTAKIVRERWQRVLRFMACRRGLHTLVRRQTR